MSNMTESEPFWSKIFGACGAMVLALPISLYSLLIVCSILKYEAMRMRKELLVLAGLAFADSINLLQFFGEGLYRLMVLLEGQEDLQVPRADCLTQPLLWLSSFSKQFSGIMLCVVSIDRLLLIAFGRTYIFKLRRVYSWCMVGVPFAFCACVDLVGRIAVYNTPDGSLVSSMCYTSALFKLKSNSSSTVAVVFTTWHEYSRSVWALASVLIFVLIPPLYKWQQAKIHPIGQDDAEYQRQAELQAKVTKSRAISCVCTFVLVCVPGRLTYVFWFRQYWLLSWTCILLILTNPLANAFIYHFAHIYMRTAMFGLLRCKTLPTNIELWQT